MTRFARVYCIVAFFAMLGSAHATIVFDFSGTVTQVPVDEVFGDINFGDAFQGSFSFDPLAPSLIPGDPTTASYRSNSPLGMTVTIGGHHFDVSDGLNIGIVNSGLLDQYTVLSQSASGDLSLELFLQDNTASVFATDQLPLVAPSLATFGQRDFHLSALTRGGEIQVDGQLTALGTEAVPEPAAAGTFLVGAVVFLTVARLRRPKFNSYFSFK